MLSPSNYIISYKFNFSFFCRTFRPPVAPAYPAELPQIPGLPPGLIPPGPPPGLPPPPSPEYSSDEEGGNENANISEKIDEV